MLKISLMFKIMQIIFCHKHSNKSETFSKRLNFVIDHQVTFVTDPYTTYKIWLEGIVDGVKTPESERILANTDVDQPSAPTLTNVTCYDTGMIYVEWTRYCVIP